MATPQEPLFNPPPKPPDPHAAIARINEISALARTTWFGLLAYLAFVGVTLLAVEDADFFVPARRTDLPLVNVAIPTADFFLFAPLLGAALYAYLHLQLLKLWEALAEAPATIAGQPLAEHVYPWLITDFALSRRPGALRPRPLRRLANVVTQALVYWAGPLVLLGFWARSMPAHSERMTLIIALCLAVAVYVGATGWWRAQNLLLERDATPWSGWLWLKRPLGLLALCALLLTSWLTTEGGTEHRTNQIVDLLNDMRPAGEPSLFHACIPGQATEPAHRPQAGGITCDDRFGEEKPKWLIQEQTIAIHPWVRTLRELTFDTRDTLFGFVFGERHDWTPLAPADLAGVEVIAKPADWRDYQTARRRFRTDWCKQQGIDLEICARSHSRADPAPPYLETLRTAWCAKGTRGIQDCPAHFRRLDNDFQTAWDEEWSVTLAALDRLDLSRRDLRGANLSAAFLASGLDLRGARMEGANLSRARMERADLRGARMERADLRGARMERADLSGARMEGAGLIGARMEGADLSGARMEGANLSRARMEGAGLSGARIEGADLSGARMEGANLRWARIEGADLSRARMEGANLRWARIEGADLRWARIEGADLSRARIEGADLKWARIEGASLNRARMAESDCTSAAFLAALVQSADITCRSGTLTQAQLTYTVGNADTRLPSGLHVWSCLDRTSLPPEIAEQITAALARHPDDRGLFRLSRSDIEAALFCDPDDPDPIRRSPHPMPPPSTGPQR